MKSDQMRYLVLLAAAVALTACGGGGGGATDDTEASAPAPQAASPAPTSESNTAAPPAGSPAPAPDSGGSGASETPASEPTSPATGLDLEPSLVLSIDTSSPGALATSLEATLGKLIDDAKSAYAVAPLAAAISDFAKLAPNGQEPVAGGQYGAGCVSGSLTASGATYSLSNCELNGHVASGTAVMSVSGSTYRLDFSGLQITPAGGSATTVTGHARCDVAAGAAPQCTVQIEPNAPAWTQTFRYGWDSSYVNGVASGTHMCGVCDQTWLVQLNSLTAASGSALVKASNGTATIQRVDANTWSGSVTANGSTFGPINGINR